MFQKKLSEYRIGASGALMDEYERALFELKFILQNVTEADYMRLADAQTENEDCRSIQTIVNHLVASGYYYSNYIRQQLSMNVPTVEPKQIVHSEINREFDRMLAYTIEIFDGKWKAMDEKMEIVTIETRWGMIYTIDQLLEHAIVHALKHRRQIEKFILKFAV